MLTGLGHEVHRNMVDAFATLPDHQPAGFVWRGDDILLSFTGSPVDFFNEVLPVDGPLTPEAAESAVAVARRGVPWVLHLRDGVDDVPPAALAELGLVETKPYFYPAMALTELPDAAPPPPGLEIRTVTSEAAFEEHLAAGGANPDVTRTWLGRGIVEDEDATLLTGYADGRAVARSMAYRTGRTVGIFNVGVEPGMRRRGYGWAMTLAAIRSGADRGCSIAALQSSEAGFPVYAAHGFRTLFDYRSFVPVVDGTLTSTAAS